LNAQSAVERIRKLAAECKQLSNKSTQIYEQLYEDPELKKLDSQLQEAKQHTNIVQAQLKHLSPIERMKRSQEQRTAQQLVLTMQNRVMEVTQKIQSIQEEAYILFEEIEGHGTLLDQVVVTVEKQLEGTINEAVV
jgi:chromosome segregation ATPase